MGRLFQEAMGVTFLLVALIGVVAGAVLVWLLPPPWNLGGIGVTFAAWWFALRLSAGRPAW